MDFLKSAAVGLLCFIFASLFAPNGGELATKKDLYYAVCFIVIHSTALLYIIAKKLDSMS